MGYEGHVVGIESREVRTEKTAEAMALLVAAHEQVGGEVVSAGGTGTYDINTWATEIQAGSYVLLDTAYGGLEQSPFRQGLAVLATVIHVNEKWAVADAGLKALSTDHGDPPVEGGTVWFYSDEHVTFAPDRPLAAGDRVLVRPSHIDPTIAKHETMHVVRGEDVLESWPVDLRGW
jgi:D-serine deaminase-like pyridoxal phosphate-dependent protein